jgi:LuxR family maltose regulon positive regulatory protein
MPVALLRTKLTIPSLRPGRVPRPRLIERLDAGQAAELALVVAPAGFGKTTLVSDWIAHLRHADAPLCDAAWLSLDEADNDPLRFAAHLTAALQGVEPALGEAVQALLRGSQMPPAEMVVTALINDLVAASMPIVLVLDDYHVIQAEWVHTALSFLLDHQPPSLHLVLIAREDPPLPLSRLRAHGQMVEIRAGDLRFTLDEATTFLNQTMGLSLTTEAAAMLETRTEGWIAGLQLAALALQECQDTDVFIEAFSGSHRYVIDYLVDEVLRCQSSQVQAFLIQTSILERLCAPLCEAIIRAEPDTQIDGQAMLAFLEQVNLFLIPLDDERRWYRYHRLFADSLRAQLDPSQRAVLHRRAAGWFRESGLLPEAIRHALAARDCNLAADLLAEAGREASLWSGGDFGRYLTWIEALPPEAIQGRPRLQLCYGRALYLYGRLAEAEQVLTAADEHLQSAPVQDEELMAVAAVYRAQCALEHGDFQTTQQLAEYAIEHLAPAVELDRARAYYALASAHYAQGHVGTAEPLFERASQIAARKGALSLAISSGECAARCLALRGRLEAARQKSEQVIALGQLGQMHHPMIVGALLTLGEVAYQQNDLDRVEPLVQQAIGLTQQTGTLIRAQQCWAYQQLARLYRARGDLEGATRAWEQADVVAHEVDSTFYLRVSAARQEHQGTIQNPSQAMVLHEPVYMPSLFYALVEFENLVRAFQLIARRRAEDALPILECLLVDTRRDGRGLNAITLRVWRALALQSLGRSEAAVDALAQAVTQAAPERCVRPFLDVGPAVGSLLQKLAQKAGGGFARVVCDAFAAETPGRRLPDQAGERPSTARTPDLIEPLSDHELEVLRLIAEGLSNKEIAERLFIGVGTVKWYATTIYGKLDVSSRTQAVARARELDLLS